MAIKDGQPRYILTPTELAAVVNKSLPAITKSFKDQSIRLMARRSGLPPDHVREYLEKEGADYSFRVISHLNLRGGCSKTTATVSLATRAKQYGHRVCILDLDSQASASLAFKVVVGENHPVFLDIFDEPQKVRDSLVEIEPNLSIVPSSLNNGLLDATMANKPNLQKTAVAHVCEELKKLGFTLVVIDCSPSLSASVISTICASSTIVIPVASDIFSRRGLELTLEEVHSICETFGLPVPEIKILFSKYDGREKLSIDALSELAKDPKYSSLLLPCFIRTSSELPKSAKIGETVFACSRKNSAREDYDMYTREILNLNRFQTVEAL
jgi:chromosome partitioning protein